MNVHLCEVCGEVLSCPNCNPPHPKKRPLNAQAQAVKDCLDAYVAARFTIKQPYPGVPPVGKVVQWLGQQLDRNKAVELFKLCCRSAAMAHQLDSQYHPFPMTIPKFVEAIPKLTGTSWITDAQRNAAKPIPEDPATRELRYRAERCLRDNPGCRGGDEPACRHCAKTAKGSKR